MRNTPDTFCILGDAILLSLKGVDLKEIDTLPVIIIIMLSFNYILVSIWVYYISSKAKALGKIYKL